jgi:CDP-6-deoxy-D-xylo-4-hexulose-3-dehydrase
MVNADYVDKNGLFVGNHHVDITREIDLLNKVINVTASLNA